MKEIEHLSLKKMARHGLIRVLGFPCFFVASYVFIMMQYSSDPLGYGPVLALSFSVIIMIVLLIVEIVLLMLKRNPLFLVNIAILLVLLIFGLALY